MSDIGGDLLISRARVKIEEPDPLALCRLE
jgi:hypothetical protein